MNESRGTGDGEGRNASERLTGRMPAWERKPPASVVDLDLGEALSRLAKWSLRTFYDTNPFYLISACFVLYALSVFFETDNIWMNTAVPLAIFAFYTVLLSATTVLIVKCGGVWDDARTLGLTIVALFCAMSVGLDGKIMDHYADNFRLALALVLFGLGFCVFVSESLTRMLRIRLSWWLKGAYYGLLTLFFIYPLIMAGLINEGRAAAIIGMAGFPVVAGLALTPAARMGEALVEDNGTPWAWPWFPWTLFGALGMFACFRSYLLSLSFFPGSGSGPYSQLETGFSLYMLIPFVFCCLVPILEHGVKLKKTWLSTLALSGTGLFFLFALSAESQQSPLHREFVRAVLGRSVTPMFVAFAAAILFYLYAWIRRAERAEVFLFTLLALASLIDVKGGYLRSIGVPSLLPLCGVGGMLLWRGIVKHRSPWALAAAVCFVLGLTIQFKGTWFTAVYGACPIHLMFFSTLTIAALFTDAFARELRKAVAAVIPALFLVALFFHQRLAPDFPGWLVGGYLIALIAVVMVGALHYRSEWWFLAFLAIVMELAAYFVLHGYRFLVNLQQRGVIILFWGALFFFIAFGVSAFKGIVGKGARGNGNC